MVYREMRRHLDEAGVTNTELDAALRLSHGESAHA